MKKTLSLPFGKLHALGNDFIVAGEAIRTTGTRPASGWLRKPLSTKALQRLARAICDRHTGLGADGFLLVGADPKAEYDAVVRFFNADGSEAEMSGNGIRCVGAFLMDSEDRKSPLRVKTMAGVKVLEVVKRKRESWTFRVRMGRPVLEPQNIPFGAAELSGPVVGYSLPTRHGKQRVTVTSMGNPHCSLFVKSFDRMDWPALGREIEIHPLFPNRTNVEFVRVVSRRKIEVRFWERGVGITASSGTGSCAAAVASILNGLTDRRVVVDTTAGKLKVFWSQDAEVTLTGPAAMIAQGSYYYAGELNRNLNRIRPIQEAESILHRKGRRCSCTP
jgi:diaminopimelate epimerase